MDIFCLLLVDLYFWHISQQKLKQKILFSLCPLADKALIYIDFYTFIKPLDIPAGLFTTNKTEELQASLDLNDNYKNGSIWVLYTFDRPMNLYKLA